MSMCQSFCHWLPSSVFGPFLLETPFIGVYKGLNHSSDPPPLPKGGEGWSFPKLTERGGGFENFCRKGVES